MLSSSLIGLDEVRHTPALTGQQEGDAERRVDGDGGDAVQIAGDHDDAAQVVQGGVVGELLGVHAVVRTEEALVHLVHLIVALREVRHGGKVVVDQGGSGGSQDAVHALGLALNELDQLGRQLDIIVDLALGGAGDATNLVAHALEVEIDVNDRLEQADATGLCVAMRL